MNRLKTAILTELPCPCNFNKCEYCYIQSNDPRRKDKKEISSDYYYKLMNRFLDKDKRQWLWWFCSVGETSLHRNFPELVTTLSKDHAVMVNTNFATKKIDCLLNCPSGNIGVWFSIHWDQLQKLNKLFEIKERLKKFLDKGITVFPMMLLYPSYINQIDEIIEFFNCGDFAGIKIMITQYRDFKISRLENGLVEPSPKIMKKLRENSLFDWSHYDNASKRWEIKDGYCSSGIDFLVVDSRWQVRSCGGKGHINFGVFPEGIDQMQFREKGICEADTCPCSWVIFHGVNDKFNMTLSDVFKVKTEGKLKEFFKK